VTGSRCCQTSTRSEEEPKPSLPQRIALRVHRCSFFSIYGVTAEANGFQTPLFPVLVCSTKKNFDCGFSSFSHNAHLSRQFPNFAPELRTCTSAQTQAEIEGEPTDACPVRSPITETKELCRTRLRQQTSDVQILRNRSLRLRFSDPDPRILHGSAQLLSQVVSATCIMPNICP